MYIMHLSMLCPRGGTRDMAGTLIASSILRLGICTNFEIASSPRVGNFDQMRRRAVLVASHVNELHAKKATHVLQDFGFGLIFFNVIAIRVNNDSTVVLYYLSVVQTSILSS